MAKAAAAGDTDAPAKPAGPSLIVQIIVLLVLTGVAAGVGLFAGNTMTGGKAEEHVAPAGPGGHGEATKEKAEDPVDPKEADAKRGVIALAPVTTNLAAPADTWIRLELAAVFEGEPDLPVADAVHQDVIAFLRTVKLHQVEGPSGFQHLKEDLDERAAMRSEGKIKSLLVRALLIE